MALVQFFKTRKQTAIMLDLVEETLHQVPLFVPMFVVSAGFFAVFASRNDRFSAFFSDFLQKWARIIGAVRIRTFKFEIRDQIFRLSNVMPLATRQKKAQGIPEGVYAGMDFGAEPAPAAAEGLLGLPPFFWAAPAAQGWARITLLSRIRFSISGSSTKC